MPIAQPANSAVQLCRQRRAKASFSRSCPGWGRMRRHPLDSDRIALPRPGSFHEAEFCRTMRGRRGGCSAPPRDGVLVVTGQPYEGLRDGQSILGYGIPGPTAIASAVRDRLTRLEPFSGTKGTRRDKWLLETGQRRSASDGECRRCPKAATGKVDQQVAGPVDCGPSDLRARAPDPLLGGGGDRGSARCSRLGQFHSWLTEAPWTSRTVVAPIPR